jgi:hypothetical protein
MTTKLKFKQSAVSLTPLTKKLAVSKSKYLGEFESIFEKALGLVLGDQVKLLDEKKTEVEIS